MTILRVLLIHTYYIPYRRNVRKFQMPTNLMLEKPTKIRTVVSNKQRQRFSRDSGLYFSLIFAFLLRAFSFLLPSDKLRLSISSNRENKDILRRAEQRSYFHGCINRFVLCVFGVLIQFRPHYYEKIKTLCVSVHSVGHR